MGRWVPRTAQRGREHEPVSDEKLHLYLLSLTDQAREACAPSWEYDYLLLVAARSPYAARVEASNAAHGDIDRRWWLNPTMSRSERLGVSVRRSIRPGILVRESVSYG